jgi:hypothetical protein
MAEYGVTDKGFNIKRLDTIMEEIHTDLTEAFGFDTRLTKPSFLDTLITTFSYQISDLWETAQDNYYAKYPATATGVSLDNAVQYGGIRRAANKRTSYRLHCTGDDGTYVREEAIVATNTSPEVRLKNADEFEITRDAFNRVSIKVASAEVGVYSATINGSQYSFSSPDGVEEDIITGLAKAITDDGYTITAKNNTLTIEDKTISRSNVLILSDNLTTSSVTVIATFLTEEYGKITLPYGIVTKMVNNVTGFTAVTNLLEPTYGRKQENDIELRQSYIAKSALRSNTMIESIVGELLNNIENVESASGYENDTDYVDSRGLPPHSIEIIVEGGDNSEIAQAILRRKAGGIQTYGSIEVGVPGVYGDTIPVRFNRPDYLYTWLKVVLHGDKSQLPTNYASLTIQALISDGAEFVAGTNLLTQLLNDGIYDAVAGLTYVEIYTAYGTSSTYVPESSDYKQKNIIVTSRQKVLIDEKRIEVSFSEDS